MLIWLNQHSLKFERIKKKSPVMIFFCEEALFLKHPVFLCNRFRYKILRLKSQMLTLFNFSNFRVTEKRLLRVDFLSEKSFIGGSNILNVSKYTCTYLRARIWIQKLFRTACIFKVYCTYCFFYRRNSE